MEEKRKYLLEQGIWEHEIDEVLSNFDDDIDESELTVLAIYDSLYDLGSNYIDNVVGELDKHIDAVLDYSLLGEEVAASDDSYVILGSGRVVEFQS